MSVIRLCRKAALALAAGTVALLGAAPLGAQPAEVQPAEVTMQVTPEAGRQLVAQALATRNPELAVRIARQLLAANPGDIETQVLLAGALSRAGQAGPAISTGKQAFRATSERRLKFQAAFLTAEALAAANRPGAAKWWLRRADSYRSDDSDQAPLRRGFATLDQRTPLKFTLTLGAGPSNNVNGGSLHDSFDFYGIPIPIDQALPGYTGIAAAQLSYRLHNAARSQVLGFVRLRHREIWLSERARRLQPDARASYYSYDAVDLGLSGQWRATQTLGLTYAAQVGRQWYGSGTEVEVQRLQFGLAKVLPKAQLARLDLTAEATQNPTAPRTNTVRLAADASLAVMMGKNRLTGTIGLTDVSAEAPGIPYRSVSLGVEAAPPAVLDGLDLEFFASVEAKDYWKAATPNPDLVIEAGATAKLTNMSLLGFSPTATVAATRSVSDIVVRDSFNLGLSIGLRSTF